MKSYLQILILIFVSLLFLGTASKVGAANPPVSTRDSSRIEKIASIVEDIEINGLVLPDRRQFAIETLSMEKSAGTKFGHDEIRRLASEETRLRGVSKYGCFTSAMRVLTPKGYVAIASIGNGDEIISWDIDRKRQIINRVKSIQIIQNRIFGRLCNLSPTGKAIETTSDHPFYSADAKNYVAIGDMAPTDRLIKVDGCEASLVFRGAFDLSAGTGTVFHIGLELPPNNFIVEGILVHNKGTSM